MKGASNKKHTDLFKELLDEVIEPEKLRKTLTRLYFDYSRLVIRDCENGSGLPEDIDTQLYYLSQIIEVCDSETVYPQLLTTKSN